MMLMQIIFVCFFLIKTISGTDQSIIISWTQKRHFCSSDIAVVMGLVCTVRKSRHSRSTGNMPEFQYFRGKRGITDECCTNECSPLDMQEYCHESTEKTSTNKTLIWSRSIGGYGIASKPIITTTTTAKTTTTTTTTTKTPFCYCCPVIKITFN